MKLSLEARRPIGILMMVLAVVLALGAIWLADPLTGFIFSVIILFIGGIAMCSDWS